MNRIIRSVCYLGLISILQVAYATDPLPKILINFESQQGLRLFKDSINPTSIRLLSHFTTQLTNSYCGVASVVMILNASDIPAPPDPEHFPYHEFTQDNFFNDNVRKIIQPDVVLKKGITLTQLTQIINAYNLKAKQYFANQVTIEQFRRLLRNAIHQQKFIIVNFYRPALNQTGSGHHSPIVAYDKATDRFLLLDVARYKYPAYWVKTVDLWKAVHTLDGNTYRGFIIIENTKHP